MNLDLPFNFLFTLYFSFRLVFDLRRVFIDKLPLISGWRTTWRWLWWGPACCGGGGDGIGWDGDEDFGSEMGPAPLNRPIILLSRERKSERFNRCSALYDCFKSSCLGTSERGLADIRYRYWGHDREGSLTRDLQSLETWNSSMPGLFLLTLKHRTGIKLTGFKYLITNKHLYHISCKT